MLCAGAEPAHVAERLRAARRSPRASVIDSQGGVAYFEPMAGLLRRPIRYRYYNATIILIVLCVIVFLIGFIDRRGLLTYLYLIPAYVLQAGYWWMVVTYLFVHSGWAHIFFNMLALFIFGIQLERRMGSTEFLLFYFFAGIGAGISTVLINSATGQGMVPVVGASGAIYGLLLAYASFFPDARIYVFGILPIRAPLLVVIYAGIEIFSTFTGFQAGVAHLAHLAGLAFGYLYLVVRFGMNPVSIFLRRR